MIYFLLTVVGGFVLSNLLIDMGYSIDSWQFYAVIFVAIYLMFVSHLQARHSND